MKKLLVLICSVLVLGVGATPLLALSGSTEQRAGDSITFYKGSVLNIAGDAQASAPTITRTLVLGAPALASGSAVVSSTTMSNRAYALHSGTAVVTTATLDVPRNITATVTTSSTADTPGTLTIVGTNIADEPITEALALTSSTASPTTTTGAKAFKTVTSIASTGWVAVGGTDSIVVGVGNKLACPVLLATGTTAVLSTSGTVISVQSVISSGTLSSCTTDLSATAYDGSTLRTIYVNK